MRVDHISKVTGVKLDFVIISICPESNYMVTLKCTCSIAEWGVHVGSVYHITSLTLTNNMSAHYHDIISAKPYTFVPYRLVQASTLCTCSSLHAEQSVDVPLFFSAESTPIGCQ